MKKLLGSDKRTLDKSLIENALNKTTLQCLMVAKGRKFDRNSIWQAMSFFNVTNLLRQRQQNQTQQTLTGGHFRCKWRIQQFYMHASSLIYQSRVSLYHYPTLPHLVLLIQSAKPPFIKQIVSKGVIREGVNG